MKTSNEKIYIYAMRKDHAIDVAKSKGYGKAQLRFIHSPEQLQGFDGTGKKLYVHSTASKKQNFQRCIADAKAGRFEIINC